MPRPYTVGIENQTIAAASGDYDLLTLDAAADKPIELVSFVVGQVTELGEAQEEQLRLKIIRGHTTAGTGGSAPTPRPLSAADAAAGFTARVADSAIGSGGTAVDLWFDAYPVRIGYTWPPTGVAPQGMGIWTSGADLLIVRLMAAVTDDIIGSISALVIEYP